jgi:tetratricopeptide (TPR) repeat protein
LHVAVGGDAYWDHNMRGNAAYGQGDWGGAVSEYSQMVAINPKRQDGYSLRAMAYFKLKQFRLSAADFRMALRYNDDAQGRAVGYQNLAYSEDYYGDHAQAIRDFTEAIRLDPTIPDQAGETADAHDDTGSSVKGRMWAYYESGQYPQALADCQALIAVHPYPSSIAVRGKIYRHMGQYGPAFADFRAALRQDPRLEFASDQLADLLAETRQYAAAVQVAQAAAQADPSSSDWRGGVGWWQYRAGQTAAAIASYRQALSMGGPQPITRFNLALAYATLGDWTDTQPALAQALWVGSPTNCHWARVDVRSALVQQPRSVPLRKALAMLQAYRRA